MQGFFWTNTIWFLLLFATSVAMVTIALVKAENRKFLIAFTLAMVGLYYIFEYVLVVAMDAYDYLPKIFPGDSFLDTYTGNIISQTSVASMCALVISLKLRARWYFIFAIVYYLIELLFESMGIFVSHWYKTVYTPLILVPLIWVVKKWYYTATTTDRKIDELLLLFFGVLAVSANTVSFPLRLLEIRVFTGGFFTDPSKDHTATSFLVWIFLLSSLIYIYRARFHWAWRAALFAGVFFVQYALYLAGLIRFKEGWLVWATLLSMVLTYFWICILGSMLKKRLPLTCDSDHRGEGSR